jgi:hypothetical protein
MKVFPGLNRPGREADQSIPFGTDVIRMGIAVLVPWYVVMVWTGTRELDTKVFGPRPGGRGRDTLGFVMFACLSPCLSERKNSAATGRIFVKLDILWFSEKFLRKFKFH